MVCGAAVIPLADPRLESTRNVLRIVDDDDDDDQLVATAAVDAHARFESARDIVGTADDGSDARATAEDDILSANRSTVSRLPSRQTLAVLEQSGGLSGGPVSGMISGSSVSFDCGTGTVGAGSEILGSSFAGVAWRSSVSWERLPVFLEN